VIVSLKTLLVAAAVVLVLIGHLIPVRWLAVVFTPLATILILCIAFLNWRSRRNSYSFWISMGLLFSLFGDVALLWPSRYFLIGLFAFLLTHVAYFIGFTRDASFPARPLAWFAYLLIIAASYAVLFPSFPQNMRLPVAVYSVLLGAMTAQAAARGLILKSPAARRAAFGAALFMLSDILLSFDRFHAALLLAPVLVLVPYYLAQWLIASSTSMEEVQGSTDASLRPA
jgi:uncharacterized membrane protein YhhN